MINQKILGINLLILFIYSAIAFMTMGGATGYDALGFAFIMMLCLAIQVIVCIIISIVQFRRKQNPIAKSYLLSTALVILIGISSCFGLVSIS